MRRQLIGFAKHDQQSGAGRIPGMLRREVEQLGLKGLTLHKLPTRDVLEAVAKLRIPVLYHPQEFSDYYMIAEAFRRFNSSWPKELGPDKIIFGSDGPEQDSRVELYKIRLLKLPPADEAKILSGNILRLLPTKN